MELAWFLGGFALALFLNWLKTPSEFCGEFAGDFLRKELGEGHPATIGATKAHNLGLLVSAGEVPSGKYFPRRLYLSVHFPEELKESMATWMEWQSAEGSSLIWRPNFRYGNGAQTVIDPHGDED